MRRFASFLSFLLQTLLRYEWLVILLFVVFLLRIPSFFEPNWYGDEAIYLTLGNAFRKGLVFYRDIHDNKPPLLYLVAAIAGDVFWFRLILWFVHSMTVVMAALLAERILVQRWRVMLATSLFALFSTLPLLEGNVANGELFMIWPASVGVYLFYQTLRARQRGQPIRFLLIGILFSLGFLFKAPIGFDFAALVFFWWWFAKPTMSFPQKLKRLFSLPVGLMVFGFMTPILLSIGYYGIVGGMVPYVRSALLQNFGYVVSWGVSDTVWWHNHLIWRGFLLIGFVGWLTVRGLRMSQELLFLSLWVVFSTYGALISNRPYPHYLLQSLLPFTLLLFVLLNYRKSLTPLLTKVMALTLVVILVATNGLWHYPVVGYYRNFIDYIRSQKSVMAYREYFGPVNRNYAIADYIRTKTLPDERVFVWGNEPAIYALTQRLPVGRYTVAYHIMDFDGFADTFSALNREKPRFIVVFPDQVPDFPQLDVLLAHDYVLSAQIDEALIYLSIETADVSSSRSFQQQLAIQYTSRLTPALLTRLE